CAFEPPCRPVPMRKGGSNGVVGWSGGGVVAGAGAGGMDMTSAVLDANQPGTLTLGKRIPVGWCRRARRPSTAPASHLAPARASGRPEHERQTGAEHDPAGQSKIRQARTATVDPADRHPQHVVRTTRSHPEPTQEHSMTTRNLRIAMNGITGRMGYRQHLLRSILPIRDQGGITLTNGDKVQVEPILVGRREN